jgi:hypothetical protein
MFRSPFFLPLNKSSFDENIKIPRNSESLHTQSEVLIELFLARFRGDEKIKEGKQGRS